MSDVNNADASNGRKLAGRTLFITGASRGIGKAIALKAAKDGANIVIAAKTADPHPKLPGTIYTAAAESKWTANALKFCLIIQVCNYCQFFTCSLGSWRELPSLYCRCPK